MVSATIIAMLIVFSYMMWRRYSEFNRRQLIICKTALEILLSRARGAGESDIVIETLLNAAIDTYNESLRGPWFYTKRWKIPHQTFMVKKNEIKRHSKRGHSDSKSEVSERQE